MSTSDTHTASEAGDAAQAQDADQDAAHPDREETRRQDVAPTRMRPQEEEDEVFEDASDVGEVQFRRRDVEPSRRPTRPVVSTHSFNPHIKPEEYDGTTDWSEYQIYFEQLSNLYGWDEEVKAAMLCVSLKGEARVVLAGLDPAQRCSYFALTTALSQSFSPKELVHLHQAELKARRKKPDESITDLGRDIAKLVRLAYPSADLATREVISINSFLEALPGPASEMKLHVIKGRPRNLQEAVAHATEVTAVMEAENRKSSRRRGDVRMVEPARDDLHDVVEQLRKDLEKTKLELQDAKEAEKRRMRKRPLKDVTCYKCGEKGHYKGSCQNEPKVQGNEPRRLSQSQ